jgi:hypothetical protein
VYQVGLMPTSCAASSRRSPAVRRVSGRKAEIGRLAAAADHVQEFSQRLATRNFGFNLHAFPSRCYFYTSINSCLVQG